MNAALSAILAILAQIAPASGSVSLIAKIIDALTALLPVLIQEYKDIVPIVKNIIAALKGNAATTGDQLDQLDVLEAQCDAAFEAAATAAQAEDDAAGT